MVEVDPIVAGSVVLILVILTTLIFFQSRNNNGSKNTSKTQSKKRKQKSDERTPLVDKAVTVSNPTPTPTASEPLPKSSTTLHEDKSASLETSKKPKETPEQKAARLERQKASKAKKASEPKKDVVQPQIPTDSSQLRPSSSRPAQQPTPRPIQPQADGWAVVEKVKVKKVKPAPTKAEVASTSDVSKKQVTVDAKKVGVIIGPKGATMKSIQDSTGAEITMPPSTREATGPAVILITGTSDAISKASKIIEDLCAKGYSALLAGEDFQESHISVHPMYLPEIIGKAGATIKAIQDQCNVRLNVPQGISRNDANKVKITIAGSRDCVAAAKVVINQITELYYSPVTHPGTEHREIDVPDRLLSLVIGPKGSEIRHIENNFKVSLYIPNADSVNKAVVVVGGEQGVLQAERYIQKIVSQAGKDESQLAESMKDWVDERDVDDGTAAGAQAEWMSEYMYTRPAAAAAPETNSAAASWNTVSSAEGW